MHIIYTFWHKKDVPKNCFVPHKLLEHNEKYKCVK